MRVRTASILNTCKAEAIANDPHNTAILDQRRNSIPTRRVKKKRDEQRQNPQHGYIGHSAKQTCRNLNGLPRLRTIEEKKSLSMRFVKNPFVLSQLPRGSYKHRGNYTTRHKREERFGKRVKMKGRRRRFGEKKDRVFFWCPVVRWHRCNVSLAKATSTPTEQTDCSGC